MFCIEEIKEKEVKIYFTSIMALLVFFQKKIRDYLGGKVGGFEYIKINKNKV